MFTCSHYLEQGSLALDACNYELAKNILDRAMSEYPLDASLLELLGIAEMEVAAMLDNDQDYVDRAIGYLMASIKILPNVGHAK